MCKYPDPDAARRPTAKNQPSGQGLAEYALILGLVALAVFIIVNLLEISIADLFSRLVQQAPVAPPSLANYTPAPTYTPVPTVDINATETATPTATQTSSPTPEPINTPTETPTPTATVHCPGYGPYAIPGRVEMENFRCGGSDQAFVDSGTLDGGPGSAAYRPDVGVMGPDLASSSDAGGGYQLGWLVTNEWTQYLVEATENRFYDATVRVASDNNNGRFRLMIIRNGAAIHTTGSISVPNTGGASSWANVTVTGIPFLVGVNEVRFIVDQPGFNINYFDVSQGTTPTTTPAPSLPCFTLSVLQNPTFGGSVNLDPAPNCSGGRYTQGTTVILSTTPNPGYAFSGWTGSINNANSSVTVTVNNDLNVTANFSQCFAVTTAVNPANSGTVSVSPAPNCGGGQYITGTNLTLSANPATGFAFTNWSGDLSGNANPANLTVNAAANITANFNAQAINSCANPTLPLWMQINFQPANTTLVTGYLLDDGSAFGTRSNGYTYGWSANNTANARDRNSPNAPDQLRDTLNHMQLGGSYTWEIAVPNGAYEVCVVAGDPDYTNSVYRINVESTLTVNHTPTNATRWGEGLATVNVSDGRISISNAGGSSNNKINFVRIYSAGITENFESGGWNGGVGWSAAWFTTGNAQVTSQDSPYNSNYHLRLPIDSSAQRTANLSIFQAATLTFYWKNNVNQATDYLYVEISNDGGASWTQLARLDRSEGQNTYLFKQLTIPTNHLAANFQVRFRNGANNNQDYFYIDDIAITGN
jgi:uncharacterized repeat protein (TIGR02543 family)